MSAPEPRQLSFFERAKPILSRQEAVRGVTWSYSRRSLLEQCSRRYYYQYFGSSKKKAKAEPAKELLYFLKTRVQNRYLLSGSVLHMVIKTYFLKARTGDVWTGDRLVGFARKVYGDSWRYSRENPDGKIGRSEKYPPTLLQEYYQKDPEADQLCANEEERLVHAVRSFATNESYRQFRAAGVEDASLVEEKIRLEGFPCKVDGKVDLAFQSNDLATILDWKLGQGDGTSDESLQLAAYALWATDRFKCEPESLRVCKVHLTSDEVVDFGVGTGLLAAARTRIIQDAERMALMESYGNEGTVEAFSRCEKVLICKGCVFRGVCHA